jgi:hypothetical protein
MLLCWRRRADHLLVAAIQMRLGLIYGNTDNPHTDKGMALEMLNKALKIRLKKYAPDHKVIKEVSGPYDSFTLFLFNRP